MVSSLDANSFATTFKNNLGNSAENVFAVKNYLSAREEFVNKSELSLSVEEVNC